MNIDEVKLLIAREIASVQKKLEKAGLASFDVPFNLVETFKGKPGVIAYAYTRGHLEFNKAYFANPESIPFAQIVAHEVCHLYQYKYFPSTIFKKVQGHGAEFRKLMKILGYSGNMRIPLDKNVSDAAYAAQAVVTKASPRKPKTKTRYVYMTVGSNREVWLTAAQHTKQERQMAYSGTSRFTSKGEGLVFTGNIKKFK